MPEPDSDKDELRKRLQKLPGQLLLAVINGTAVLVIAAAILALVTMTDGVLSRIDAKPQQVRANLQSVTADVHELLKALKQARVEAPDQISPEVAKLNDRLSALQVSIAQRREARPSRRGDQPNWPRIKREPTELPGMQTGRFAAMTSRCHHAALHHNTLVTCVAEALALDQNRIFEVVVHWLGGFAQHYASNNFLAPRELDGPEIAHLQILRWAKEKVSPEG